MTVFWAECEHGRRLVDCPEPFHDADRATIHQEPTMPDHTNDPPTDPQPAIVSADPTPEPHALAEQTERIYLRQQLVEWREHLERQTARRPIQARVPIPGSITVKVEQDARLGDLLVLEGSAEDMARFGDLTTLMIGEALTR
jgi:hypothetical protein